MKVIDLFCGAGGFSEGFKQEGFNIIFGVDIDKDCCDTFAKNHKCEVICDDIRNIKKFPQADIVIGSPPCQNFSVANRKRNFDLTLVNAFIEVVEKIKPKFWIMENVCDLLKVFNPDGLNVQILEAHKAGVPSLRKRVFIGQYPRVNFNWQFKNIRNYIQLKRPGFIPRYILNLKNKPKEKKYGWAKIDKINPDGVLYTICAHDAKNFHYLHPNGTVFEFSELARLMTFPDDYVFIGSITSALRQVGNAVPPLLAKKIAESIKGFLGENINEAKIIL